MSQILPAMLLGTVLVSWADRWPQASVMVRFQCLPRGCVLLAPLALILAPICRLSWGTGD